MSVRKPIGNITAYAAAVAGGYTGTYEQFCKDQANFAKNAAAVAEDRKAAEQARTDTEQIKENALTEVGTAKAAAVTNIEQAASSAVDVVASAGNSAVNDVNATAAVKKAEIEQLELVEEVIQLAEAITVTKSLTYANTTAVPEDADLNEYLTEGNYKVNSAAIASTIANIPITVAGRLTVTSVYMEGRIRQEYDTLGGTYRRHYNGTSWGDWEKISVSTDFDKVTLYRRALTSVDDVNVILENGRYNWVSSSIPQNCPFSRGGVLFVYKGGNSSVPTLHTVQVAIPDDESGYFFRVGTSVGMGEWVNAMYNPLNAIGVSRKENFVITEFEWLPYWYKTTGELDNVETHFHSQLIPVNEGSTYYLGWKLASQGYSGAFFDRAGNWIAPLIPDDITIAEYPYPDGTGKFPSGNITYTDIYQFTAPAGACFFSWNLRTAENVMYKQYVATMPVHALANSGNYAWDDDLPAFQSTKDKKLCVIGASTVMINRLLRKVQADPEHWEHIVGFQEYLYPWYKDVVSYGFSSGSWRRNDGAENLSIYNGIVTNAVDLSDCDEFLLRHSNSGFSSDKIGDATIVDTDTYIGGMKAVIDYIYTASPLAKIYVSGVPYDEDYYTDESRKTLVDTTVAELKKLCAVKGCHYIDPTNANKHSGNVDLLTYDGKHNNQEGSKREGLFYRKILVGF